MRLLSVNVGIPRDNPWKKVERTGMHKCPVLGPVAVTAPGPKGNGDVGLAGDRAYDVQHHGGTDQAVYAYAREDLDRWETELDRPLAHGAFGENLTTDGLDVNAALIGERWQVGPEVVLEITYPRIPCSTFEGWMGIRGWNRRFLQAAVPGAYFRVVTPGSIEVGDPVRVVRRPDHDVTVALAFRAYTLERDLMPHLHAAGIG